MTKKSYKDGTNELITAIDFNYDKGFIMPSLVLFYATLDTMAWLNREPGHQDKDTRSDFKGWVKTYLMPGSGLNCIALDLYAARCAILHSYSSESSLSELGDKKGYHAKKFYYTYKRPSGALQWYIDRSSQSGKTIALQVEVLIASLKVAIQRYDRFLSKTPSWAKVVYGRANKFMQLVPVPVINNGESA